MPIRVKINFVPAFVYHMECTLSQPVYFGGERRKAVHLRVVILQFLKEDNVQYTSGAHYLE